MSTRFFHRKPRAGRLGFGMLGIYSYLVVLVSVLWLGPVWAAEDLYQDAVRPILAKNCFECHGPDESARKAKLRLDRSADALASRKGGAAIVAGDPDNSLVFQRMTTADADDLMPPPESHKVVTAEEIEVIRQWIAAGAKYREHWAFVPPVRSTVPVVSDANWPVNAIDHFILARLEEADLDPSAEADRYTVVRRLYLDLVGVVPSPEEVDRFLRDEKPGAYARVVDRLLASPRYGERWARAWLDLARYSDTNGYEKDRERSIWPYRDWVIRALNRDQPFDEFTIEQLAGDMLPGASDDQRIATGFHRNTMLNEEGGIDPLEYRFYAMVDRVATTGAVWLGLTTGCAQCHSHKYDPISHQEYYSLMALMDNADEPDLLLADPQVQEARRDWRDRLEQATLALKDQYPLGEDSEAGLEDRRTAFEAAFAKWVEQVRPELGSWTTVPPQSWETNLGRLEVLDDGSVFASGDATKRDVYRLTLPVGEIDGPIAALRLEVLPDDRLPARGPGRAFYEGRKGDFFVSELDVKADGQTAAFADGSSSYGNVWLGRGPVPAENVFDGEGSTGWATTGREGEANYLVLNFAEPIEDAEVLEVEMFFERHYVASLGRFRLAVSDRRAKALPLLPQWESALARKVDEWSETEKRAIEAAFVRAAPELAEARKSLTKIENQAPKYLTTMVMQERPEDNPRLTYRRHRGEYLSAREAVDPGVPAVLLRDGSQPENRLELARWLVSSRNPLVGRVTVNRNWRAFFGAGLLRTSGDFGTQSAQPSHPELLDWLALEFMESGWSLKRLHRLMVMSRTYRQASVATPELMSRDPENRLLARGPRYRLDGELLRDAMLSASGLLVDTMHGPSVRPPQPASVTALAYGNTRWSPAEGEDRFRRSLYTYSKRTAPFAAYTVFDAPSGENCTPRRNRSNTPLQALTVLNDEMYLEFARALAGEVIHDGEDAAYRIDGIVRRLLTRPPDAREREWLLDFQQSQLRRLQAGELSVKDIVAGESGDAELASWILLARAVMNLDEAVTK